jgi:penicillin-binding protein 2
MYVQSPPPRPEREPDRNQLVIRAAALGVLAAVLFGVLLFRLWALQVLHSDHYVAQANQNDVRTLALPAPRGEIVDRTGAPLVTNSSRVLAQVNPAGLPIKVDCATFPADSQATCERVVAATPAGAVPKCAALRDQPRCIELARLGHVLGMSRRDVWRAYEKTLLVNSDGSGGCVASKGTCYVVNAGAPLPITTASEPQVAYVLERRDRFPGVQFIETTQRQYPFGKTVAPNVLGYDGQISEAELKDPNFHGLGPGVVVGQAGVEYSYDSLLRGQNGELQQSYDATGHAVGQAYLAKAPTPGPTLQLTIDYRLQQVAQRAIAYGIQVARNDGEVGAHTGALVAMDPNTGEIYAMASYPSYDPSAFLPPAKRTTALYNDKYNQPLVDKTLLPTAPGSTFKPITAVAAWNEGLIGPGSHLDCPGVFYRKDDFSHTPFRNWNPYFSGNIDLPTALEISCDTFFYQLGSKFYDRPNQGIDFQRQIRRFGFGSTPAIDLPVPSWWAGLVPDPTWRLQHYPDAQDQIWQPGYDIQMAIGQGDLTVSPMQLAVAYSALANGGKLVTPHVGRALLGSDGQVTKRLHYPAPKSLGLSPELLAEIRDGLIKAAHDANGTSSAIFGNFIPTVAGKTGTAEVGGIPPLDPNAWYAAFAPADHPRLVVVALITNGGHGGTAAAPAALKVFQAYFGKQITNVVGTDKSN